MHCLLVLVYRRVDIAAHSPLAVAHMVDGKGVGEGIVGYHKTQRGRDGGGGIGTLGQCVSLKYVG